MSDRTLQALRRRLEKLELEHLNTYITEMQEKLERAERRAERAEDTAEYWREECMHLMVSMKDEMDFSLTKDGQIIATENKQDGQQ